jgi:hypothetical protein
MIGALAVKNGFLFNSDAINTLIFGHKAKMISRLDTRDDAIEAFVLASRKDLKG